jgi:hypothetical protein
MFKQLSPRMAGLFLGWNVMMTMLHAGATSVQLHKYKASGPTRATRDRAITT